MTEAKCQSSRESKEAAPSISQAERDRSCIDLLEASFTMETEVKMTLTSVRLSNRGQRRGSATSLSAMAQRMRKKNYQRINNFIIFPFFGLQFCIQIVFYLNSAYFPYGNHTDIRVHLHFPLI